MEGGVNNKPERHQVGVHLDVVKGVIRSAHGNL